MPQTHTRFLDTLTRPHKHKECAHDMRASPTRTTGTGQSSALVSAPPNKTYQPTPRPDQPSLPPPLARPVLHPPSKSPRGRRAPLQCSRRARPPLYLKMGAQSLEVFTDMSSAMMRPYIPSAEAVPWIRTWGEQRTNAASARPRPGKGDGSWGAWGGGRGVRAPCPRTAW